MDKFIKPGYYSLIIILLMAGIMSFAFRSLPDNSVINGAWKLQNGTVEQVLIFNNGYFMHTTFDKSKKLLISTRGGAYKYAGNKLEANIEFSPNFKEEIGQTKTYSFAINKDRLSSDINGKKASWTMLDKGKGPMVGTWRSSGRMQEGKVVFDGKVEGDLWHHSGFSSQGAKMYEIWKMEPKH